METCTILIVEDESLVAMDMADMLTRLGYKVLPAAMDHAEAIKAIDTHKPDLVLVDISLSGEKTGIDVANHIGGTIPFIFVTSHSDKQTVSLAVASEPNGYLLKPFDANDLYTSIEVAMAGFASKKDRAGKTGAASKLNDSIFIKTDKHFVKVKVDDICCLESEHNYIFVHSLRGKHIVRSNFKDFLLNVPNDRFMQVHKSFVVNLDRVDHFSHTDITVNGKEIPLSRMYKDDFFARMNRVQ
jgi:two-component system response regulator LytT